MFLVQVVAGGFFRLCFVRVEQVSPLLGFDSRRLRGNRCVSRMYHSILKYTLKYLSTYNVLKLLKKRVVIKGERVQDVGYRLFLLEAAESLGLRGFQARNVEDYVEFLVEGEEESVSRFIVFAKNNYPGFARVEKVVDEDFDGYVMSVNGFYRSFSLNQLVKIVNVGVDMLGKQDMMLEKQDVLINEVRDLRSDLKAFMEERFRRIENEIARIKERIGME